MVDHFNYDEKTAAEKHDVLSLPPPKQLRGDLKDYFNVGGMLAIPRAVGQVLGNSNPLITPILRAPETAYSYNPKDENEALDDVFASGSQLSLITGFQARNAARLTVLGSAEMLQDEWFDAKVKGVRPGEDSVKSSNQKFAEALSQWTFKELGVLKVGRVQHYLNEGAAKSTNLSTSNVQEINPEIYRIKNDVVCDAESTTIAIELTFADLFHRTFRMESRPPRALCPSGRRRGPARVQHAFALPPPQARPNIKD